MLYLCFTTPQQLTLQRLQHKSQSIVAAMLLY